MDASFQASVVGFSEVAPDNNNTITAKASASSGSGNAGDKGGPKKVKFQVRVVALNIGSGRAATEWTVAKRFSDFVTLSRNLKKVASKNAYLPKPPPKQVFVFGKGKKDQGFLLQRQRLLDEYIQALLRYNTILHAI